MMMMMMNHSHPTNTNTHTHLHRGALLQEALGGCDREGRCRAQTEPRGLTADVAHEQRLAVIDLGGAHAHVHRT
eukprot:1158035-Pelagomonas_calceolata.AAC.2